MQTMLSRRASKPAGAVTLRTVMGLVALQRWLSVLWFLRGFATFGPKLLPILNTFKSLGSFFVVLGFYACAFLHMAWSFGGGARSLFEIAAITYRLGILGDFELHAEMVPEGILVGDDMDAWIYVWYLACSFLLTIFMVCSLSLSLSHPVPH